MVRSHLLSPLQHYLPWPEESNKPESETQERNQTFDEYGAEALKNLFFENELPCLLISFNMLSK